MLMKLILIGCFHFLPIFFVGSSNAAGPEASDDEKECASSQGANSSTDQPEVLVDDLKEILNDKLVKRKKEQQANIKDWTDTEKRFLQKLIKLREQIVLNPQIFESDDPDFTIFKDLMKKLDPLATIVEHYANVQMAGLITAKGVGDHPDIISNLYQLIPNKLYFLTLSDYITSFNKIDDTVIRKLMKKNQAFKIFCNNFLLTQGHPFSSYLIEPIQRGPRIKLLIDSVLKYTDEDDPEYAGLKNGREVVILPGLDKINKKISEEDNNNLNIAIYNRNKSENLGLSDQQLQYIFDLPDLKVKAQFIDLYLLAKKKKIDLFKLDVDSLTTLASLSNPAKQEKCLKLMQLNYQMQSRLPQLQVDLSYEITKTCREDYLDLFYKVYQNHSNKEIRKEFDVIVEYMSTVIENLAQKPISFQKKCIKEFYVYVQQKKLSGEGDTINLRPILDNGCQ